MASFVLSFFPLDVLGGIWDLIESVSEGFFTYFYKRVLVELIKKYNAAMNNFKLEKNVCICIPVMH